MTFALTRNSRRPFRRFLLRRLLAWRPAIRSIEALPDSLRRDVGLAERGLADRS
ncbi:hypothetical protein ACFW16_14450 [Inquilinus sp. NPDC058860]|uniref:hypothetical protein n=1 Tax=Inquilinus sp. NPDC058860 TaxID=3346652 RepID=UPI0036842276